MEIIRAERTYEGLPPMPAIVMAAMEECGIRKLIDDRCAEICDREQILSPGMAVKALVGAMVERGKRPLYRVQDYFSTAPSDKLFGDGVRPSSLSDTSLSDRLDVLFRTDMRRLLCDSYGLLQTRFGFETGNMFMDATNYTMYGLDYEETQTDHDIRLMREGVEPVIPPMPAYGGNPKDGRKDLVQLNLSHVVDSNGIPIFSRSYDGNASDVTMNRDMIQFITKEFDMTSSILMADCKMCVEDVLIPLDASGTAFVTKVPSNFNGKLRETMITSVLNGTMDESVDRPGRMYYETDDDVRGRRFRVIAYLLPRSRRDAERFIRGTGLDKAWKKLKNLAGRRFFCENDARDAFHQVMKAMPADCYDADVEIVEDQQAAKRHRDGRKFRAIGSKLHIVESRVEKAVIGHALQVLITNLPFSDTHSDERRVCASADDVIDLYLEEYKVEAGFRMMKSGMDIGNVYIHTPSRISAMAFAISLATMIVKVLDTEYAKRKAKGKQKTTVKAMADIHIGTLVKYDRRHDRLSVIGRQGATDEIFDYIDTLSIDPQYLLCH